MYVLGEFNSGFPLCGKSGNVRGFCFDWNVREFCCMSGNFFCGPMPIFGLLSGLFTDVS